MCQKQKLRFNGRRAITTAASFDRRVRISLSGCVRVSLCVWECASACECEWASCKCNRRGFRSAAPTPTRPTATSTSASALTLAQWKHTLLSNFYEEKWQWATNCRKTIKNDAETSTKKTNKTCINNMRPKPQSTAYQTIESHAERIA